MGNNTIKAFLLALHTLLTAVYFLRMVGVALWTHKLPTSTSFLVGIIILMICERCWSSTSN